MGRQLHYAEDGISLELTGFTRFCAVKKRIDFPYSNIVDVKLTYFKPHFLFLRWAGTIIPPFIYEGRFRHQKKWFFVSFESVRKVPLIQLQVKEG